ncbi:hypothetical protein O3301_08465 [Janthinobacterium sp. SUN211]|uniref:hypothetical protein n=1 Tax=Janthinobacterium sp. SUN211 TaxID=3014786 RepID=UPI00271300E4|nr:hypothetical protein [Janthinobacterium sp. SUN211]MDO8048498.1 hypothetical protein [Janthinobacterium sp. SUN211]
MTDTMSNSFLTLPQATATEDILDLNLDPWVKWDYDMIHRTVVDNSTKSMFIQSKPTREFAKQLYGYFDGAAADLQRVKKFARWQRKYIDFQATYSAYLLGALTEEEFEADSEQYAPRLREIDPELLAPEIARLTELLEFGVAPAQLAEYFETDQTVVQAALEKLHYAMIDHSFAHQAPTLSIQD